MRLESGKKWFNWQVEDLRDKIGTKDWPGFYPLWKDWKGQRWVLKHLLSWYNSLPEWITNENDDEVEKAI